MLHMHNGETYFSYCFFSQLAEPGLENEKK